MELSLPNVPVGYCQRKDLQMVRGRFRTVGKVIPELKFAFWQRMFTQRHDARLWNKHLRMVLPQLEPSEKVATLRQGIYEDLEHIRKLRNRIAHHEPIFTRNLSDDFERILKLIEARCRVTADWMLSNQQAVTFISAKPYPGA